MNSSPFVQFLKLLALTLALYFLISGYINLVNRPQPAPAESIAVAPTTTPSPVPTFTVTPRPTATATKPPASATPSPQPSATATPVPTNTPVATATETPAPDDTPSATPTQTETVAPTLPPTETATSLPAPIITVTLTLTPTETISATNTPAGPPTPSPTPTITPTPVPRTVLALDLPDETQADTHFWFTRPYTDAYATWGSSYYPYGTNNNGNYLWHRGIDIQNPQGTPVQAVGDGQVVFAGSDTEQAVGETTNFYGNAVIIKHNRTWGDEPVFTLYGHLSRVLVEEGQGIETGQIIGLTGQAGIALGPHLHLEVRVGQNAYPNTQNPDLWVRPDPAFGVIAGRIIDAEDYYVPQQLITLHRTQEPNKFWRQTYSYPDNRYTPDPQLGETFTFADVYQGEYIVKTSFDGKNYTFPVTVRNGETTFVAINGDSTAPSPTTEPLTTTATITN